MSDKNVPAGANELRAEVGRPRREQGGTVEPPAGTTNGARRVKPEAREGADTVKQPAMPAKKAATGMVSGDASKAGEKPGEAGAVAEKVGVAAEQAREKAAVAAAQVSDKATQVGQKAGAVAGQVSEKATQVGQKAGAVAGQVSEKATVIAGQVGDRAGVVATQVGVTVLEAVEGLPEPVQQRVEQGVRQARQHPAVVAAGAAAVALLLWKLLRRGR
ncbi:hypothetical protein GCM10011609_09040 [Lentzea pudingi]|uniref:DUF3618 domain-containing protein n=1 Tax=Lentzea pudingi TaxID=1789439 RepID=A0ABQ2HDJ6_9PSEU|nr:hypothetical protein [Lentzea pudingi]GGM75290.1 hypothetical protein GCM10011609_09040 [Lentzea pudingi]